MPILAALLPSWLSPALLKALGIAAAIVGAFVLAAAYRASLIDLGEARANAATTAATAAAQIKGLQRSIAASAADEKAARARDVATNTFIARFTDAPPSAACPVDPNLGIVFDELQRRAAEGVGAARHP